MMTARAASNMASVADLDTLQPNAGKDTPHSLRGACDGWGRGADPRGGSGASRALEVAPGA
jgi:hypothetical protein